MNTYKIYLMKVDEDGDEYELKSRTVTADEMVELLISVPEESAVQDEPEEEEEPEPVPEKKPTNGRKVRACGICGGAGHNKKTCPQATGDKDAGRYQPPGEHPWYYQEILDLLKDETPEADIYEDYRTRITDAQFREAMEWAKSELI